MSRLDWILFVAYWSLVPAVLLLKAYLDWRAVQSERELHQKLANWVRHGRRGPDAPPEE